jgi:hypothetical protein
MRCVIMGLLFVSMVSVPASAQDAPAAALEVVEMAFGDGYDREARALVGESAAFDATTPTVYCRTRIVGAQEPTTVTHVWYRDGKTVAHVELNVGSPDWRTVSSKQLLPAWTGDWEVRVLDSAGNLLRSEAFVVN